MILIGLFQNATYFKYTRYKWRTTHQRKCILNDTIIGEGFIDGLELFYIVSNEFAQVSKCKEKDIAIRSADKPRSGVALEQGFVTSHLQSKRKGNVKIRRGANSDIPSLSYEDRKCSPYIKYDVHTYIYLNKYLLFVNSKKAIYTYH